MQNSIADRSKLPRKSAVNTENEETLKVESSSNATSDTGAKKVEDAKF